MRKAQLVPWIALLVSIAWLVSVPALGQEPDIWGGSLGVTYWYPDWSNDQADFDSSTSGLYGPSAFLHYGDFGIGIQYFTGSFDLSFPGASSDISADRTDFDLMLSYRIARHFHLSVLYKSIAFDWDQTYHVESEITGFGFGGGINTMVSTHVLLYAYGFYMPSLDYEEDIEQSGSYSGDADGFWLEAGLGYVVSDLPLLVKAGYRFQTIDVTSGSAEWSEETDGARIDISYIF
ncbi:hypothetical protein JXA80_04220 [bacterium]|nr:hypothetical protein [candidate division CSSED10-310 bacterium]